MATKDSRIGSSAQPPSNSGDGGAPQILVRISPVIEREFKRRDVFAELRIERAVRIVNGATGVHLVGIARAREIVVDAHLQERTNGLPRGLPVAYAALKRNLEACIKAEERRGVWDDPGMQEAQKRQASSSACFDVGDAVLYVSDNDGYGHEAFVVGGYETYSALNENGAYIDDNGKRFNYKRGYAIRLKDSDIRAFAAAHELTRDDCKPSHLRLVTCSVG